MYLYLGKEKILARFYVKRYLAICAILILFKNVDFCQQFSRKNKLRCKTCTEFLH